MTFNSSSLSSLWPTPACRRFRAKTDEEASPMPPPPPPPPRPRQRRNGWSGPSRGGLGSQFEPLKQYINGSVQSLRRAGTDAEADSDR